MERTKRRRLRAIVRIKGAVATVKLEGSGGVLETAAVRQTLQTLADQGVMRLLADLSELDYAGSLAVGAVLAGFVKSCPSRFRIELISSGPAVNEALANRGLSDVLRTAENRSDALDRWKTVPISVEQEVQTKVVIEK